MVLRSLEEVLWALPLALAWVTSCVDAHLRADSMPKSLLSRSTIPLDYERIFVPYKRVAGSPPWEILSADSQSPISGSSSRTASGVTKEIRKEIQQELKTARQIKRAEMDRSDVMVLRWIQRSFPGGLL